jgi:hypothetical protein
MKRPVFLLVLLLSVAIVNAQVKKPTGAKSSNRTTQKVQSKKTINSPKTDTVISLISTGINAAKASSSISVTSNQFRVSDPVVLALGERAKGNEIFVSRSGIVGMPKRAYGFANGHILLHSTVATSSGSTGGTSSVGTGGSISGMGSSGSFIGMNGKSPYAGQAMWGNARGLLIVNY